MPQQHFAPPPQQYAQPAAYPYPPPGYPPPGYPPYPYPPQGYPQPGYPQPGQPAADQQPAPVAPPPPPPPAPKEEPALPEMDEDIDDDPMAAFATDDDDDDDNLSSDDIEAMFSDEEEPGPLGSMVESDDDDDDDDEEDAPAFDDLEEPEPIPQVFTADETGDDEYDDEDEEEDTSHSKGSVLKIILAAIMALFVLIIGGAIFMREMVIEMFPASEGIYSMVGLSDDSLGAGLSINDVKSTRESISGKDVLVVRGVIVNVSKRERDVPMLELRLSDLDGKMVQSAKTAPLKNKLAADDQIGFMIQVEDPSALARRLEVTFIERTGEAAAPK